MTQLQFRKLQLLQLQVLYVGESSSMLQGAGVNMENDASSVIDKNKLTYKARKKRRMNSVALNKTALHLRSLYFDGRKDQTITQKLINGRIHKHPVVEEL